MIRCREHPLLGITLTLKYQTQVALQNVEHCVKINQINIEDESIKLPQKCVSLYYLHSFSFIGSDGRFAAGQNLPDNRLQLFYRLHHKPETFLEVAVTVLRPGCLKLSDP